ncbi:hypothetical protein QF002_002108 [Paraburkholderia youngii]
MPRERNQPAIAVLRDCRRVALPVMDGPTNDHPVHSSRPAASKSQAQKTPFLWPSADRLRRWTNGSACRYSCALNAMLTASWASMGVCVWAAPEARRLMMRVWHIRCASGNAGLRNLAPPGMAQIRPNGVAASLRSFKGGNHESNEDSNRLSCIGASVGRRGLWAGRWRRGRRGRRWDERWCWRGGRSQRSGPGWCGNQCAEHRRDQRFDFHVERFDGGVANPTPTERPTR